MCLRKFANMFLLIVQCTLHLLVLSQCFKVFDKYHQKEAEENPFCNLKAVKFCEPGQHVLCLYNETKMGPRCLDGEIVNLEYTEREFIRHIFNGFKRAIAKGEEVLGKDNIVLPRAKQMYLLHWDFRFSRAAQAWANQCTPWESDLCRNFGVGMDSMGLHRVTTQNAGQMVDVIRFEPNWTYPGHEFQDHKPKLTVEKIRFVIKEFTKRIYAERKLVTKEMVHSYTAEEEMNKYLMAIHGKTRRMGCAMAKYTDYLVGEAADTHVYNAVIIVCNFSNQPMPGLQVYKPILGYPALSTPNPNYDWCAEECRNNGVFTRNDDCLCSEWDDPLDHSLEAPPHECDEPDQVERMPAMVLMPIFTVEDPDPKKQLLKRLALPTIEVRNHELRQKIKDRVEKVRDRYFKNYFVIDPGARFPNGRPVGEDTFVLSRLKPDTRKRNIDRKGEELKLPTKRKRHTIKPRKDFSNMEHLVSEYLSHKNIFYSHTTPDVLTVNDMIQKATATVSPNEDLIQSQILSTRDLRYGVRGTPEPKPKDFEDYENINNMVQKNMRKNREDIPGTYNLLRPIKNIRQGDLLDDIGPLYIDNEQRSINEQRNTFPTRNLNPLHNAYGRNKLDYNANLENDKYVNIDDKLPVMLINSKYDEGIQNADAYFDIISSGDNLGPYVSANKRKHFNLEPSNRRRPFKQHDVKFNKFGQRQRGDSMEAPQVQRYLVPDRLNHMREL